MHEIEPFHNWRHLYTAEDDPQSPFAGREYSEFEYEHQVYNYFLHPQWDSFESTTLYGKILFADYEERYCILELIGEWNDAIENDIRTLKRNVLEPLMEQGIRKFILFAENVLNFHSSDLDYYEEWVDDLESEGWIVVLNAPVQTRAEFIREGVGRYLVFSDLEGWRTFAPQHLFTHVDNRMLRLLD